jgi:hypothetical protein
MAGSYGHIVNEKGQFDGVELLENGGDMYEAAEELYGMIWYLAHGNAAEVEKALQNYKEGIAVSPGYSDRLLEA